MKSKQKEWGLLVAIVGIVVLALVWARLYQPYQEETQTLEAACTELTQQIEQLKVWQKEMDLYEEENDTMKEDINGLLAKFPPESRKEDVIVYAADLEAHNSNTEIASIGLGDLELLYSVDASGVYLNEADEQNRIARTFSLYGRQITFANTFSYRGMKQFVREIVEDSASKSIESMSLSFDRSTGMLTGSTVLNVFTLEGTERVYQPLEITDIPVGTENIFGTLVTPIETVYEQ